MTAKRGRLLFAVLALTSGIAWAPAGAASLEGRVRMLDEKGRDLTRNAGLAMVWFEPDQGNPGVKPREFEMVTARKKFDPRILVVPEGSVVHFPNRDPILHNVFSVSGDNAFDLGLLPRGPGGSYTFENEGVVRVFCNVHHSMVAYVVVLDTPFFDATDREGRFRIDRLPEGPGTLVVWNERAEPARRRIDPSREASVTIDLDLTLPLVPPHLNKLGRPYARSRRDRY